MRTQTLASSGRLVLVAGVFVLALGLFPVAVACSDDPVVEGLASSNADQAETSTTSSSSSTLDLVNLAPVATVTSSKSLAYQPLSMINDTIEDVPSGNFWGAGDDAPQWVEFDLHATATVVSVELLISQSPSGQTVHDVLGRDSTTQDWVLLESLVGHTVDSQELVVAPEAPWQVRFLRIETSTSPSWVSWGEVRILAMADHDLAE